MFIVRLWRTFQIALFGGGASGRYHERCNTSSSLPSVLSVPKHRLLLLFQKGTFEAYSLWIKASVINFHGVCTSTIQHFSEFTLRMAQRANGGAPVNFHTFTSAIRDTISPGLPTVNFLTNRMCIRHLA